MFITKERFDQELCEAREKGFKDALGSVVKGGDLFLAAERKSKEAEEKYRMRTYRVVCKDGQAVGVEANWFVNFSADCVAFYLEDRCVGMFNETRYVVEEYPLSTKEGKKSK
jgi:hypothetical protein